MNAIEIRGLTKSFRGLYALDGLTMTVPAGAIYGFIGENGSGKSTTMKCICGHLVKDKGTIRLFERDYRDAGVRARVGALIENAGCFPNASIYRNLMMQAINLNLPDAEDEIHRVLSIVRMEDEETLRFKKCSLGMKQRIGIAMAIIGHPKLLILDEPVNGLDADGMRIIREVLTEITTEQGCTVLISSHILTELEKIATHVGIIRHGKMLAEMTMADLNRHCRTYTALRTEDMESASQYLRRMYTNVSMDEAGWLRVYDDTKAETIAASLYRRGIIVSEIGTNKIDLEEYYIDLMNGGMAA